MNFPRAAIYMCLIAIVFYSGLKTGMKLNEYRTALDSKIERTLTVREGRTVDFDKLRSENEDVKGWIWLPDSNIDYPVVQGEDNDYYLHRDIDKNYLYDGSIFIEATVEHPFTDSNENTVIYGHHMFSGAMFCDLEKYEERDYFEKHGTIIIETEKGSYDMHVIAYCNEPSDSALYRTWFDREDDFEDCFTSDADNGSSDMPDPGYLTKADFLQLIKDKALVLSEEPFGLSDTYVTLSTCAYNYDEARSQVIGILKEPSSEEHITEAKTRQPLVNKWLCYQILIGVIMILLPIVPLLSVKKREDQ